MTDSTVIVLGRYGDIVGLLPLAWNLSKRGKVRWIVSREFADMLKGVSYVEPVIWNGACNQTLRQAIRHARSNAFPNIIVPQPHQNPDSRRLTSSYQMEAWRLAGHADAFNALPTIFDRRNSEREKRLVAEWIPESERPIVLVATSGVSGPFKEAFRLLAMIRGLDCEVVDLSIVHAERPYDLLGLLDAADLLVTIDTLPLHLARASRCPVIAILNDAQNGWMGSTPPPMAVRSFRYGEAMANLEAVVDAVSQFLARSRGNVIHVADVHGSDERHTRAQATWMPDGVFRKSWGRDATSIGDARPLPFMRDLMLAALEHADDDDCVMLSNDDGAVAPGAYNTFAQHVAKFDFGCVRRDAAHCGREAFAFRAGWLRAHIESIPDVVLVVPRWDIVVAKWLRGFRGIKTTFENLGIDFFPVELPPGLIIHADHQSEWRAPHILNGAASKWNENLWAKPP